MKCFNIILASLLACSTIIAQTSVQEEDLPVAIIKSIESSEEYAFLGIYSERVSKEKAKKLGFDNPYGSYVSSVIPGTAADRAGIQPLDYLYGVDEYRPGEDQSFTHILRKFNPGQRVVIYLVRKGRKMTLPVTFGSRDDSRGRRERSKCEEPFFGVSAQSWSRQEVDGVPVTIVANSTAKAIGMKDGDIITAFNGHKIIDWSDVTIAIDNMEVGEEVIVEFVRNGRSDQRSGAIKSYCETKNIKPDWEEELKNAPDPGDWFNRYFSDKEQEEERVGDAGAVSISIQDMDREDAREVRREKGISLNESVSLAVKGLTFSTESGSGSFQLSFSLPQEGPTVVKVYNDSGRMIYNYDLGDFNGEFEDEIDITGEGKNTYYLEINQGKESLLKKLTISKG